MGQPTVAGPTEGEQSSKSRRAANSRGCTASARKPAARTVLLPTARWCKRQTETFMGRRWVVGPANPADGCGTIFEITPAGQLTPLYSFGFSDGAFPYAGLIQATNGNFYGTTSAGGTNGQGTVFGITQSGQLTTLYNFCSQSNCADGSLPYAGLIQASDGNLYGTTQDGGASGYGTTFGITLDGQLSTLHSFDLTDGAYPDGGLLELNGDLYGTPYFGGTRLDGTVFSLPVGLDLLAERHSSSSKERHTYPPARYDGRNRSQTPWRTGSEVFHPPAQFRWCGRRGTWGQSGNVRQQTHCP